MFGGLEIKGGSDAGSDANKDEQEGAEAVPGAPAASGFSFLAGPAVAAEEIPAESTAGNGTGGGDVSGSSAFGFLSGGAGDSADDAPGVVATAPAMTEDDSAGMAAADAPASEAAAPGSSFSFLSGGGGGPPADETAAPAAVDSAPEQPSSGFGFLSGEGAPPSDAGAAESAEGSAAAAAAAEDSIGAGGGGGTMFSFLNAATSSTDAPAAASADAPPSPGGRQPSAAATSIPPSPARSDAGGDQPPGTGLPDLLSAQHAPPPPAGSGIVFGGAAPRPPIARGKIKKRNRTKRVGTATGPGGSVGGGMSSGGSVTGASSLPPPSPMPETPNYGGGDSVSAAAPATPAPEGYGDLNQPSLEDDSYSHVSAPVPTSSASAASGSIASDAEEAARKAERFMEDMHRKEAERSAVAAAPLDWRGMSSKAAEVTEDYGGSTSAASFAPPPEVPNYDDPPPSSREPSDETYLEAKLAAEKAQAAMAEMAAKEGQSARSNGFGFFKKAHIPSIFSSSSSTANAGVSSSSIGGGRSVSSGGTGVTGGAEGGRPPAFVETKRAASIASATSASAAAAASRDAPSSLSVYSAREEAERRAKGVAEAAERTRAAAAQREEAERRQREEEEREAARKAAEEAERKRQCAMPEEKFMAMLTNFGASSERATDRVSQLRKQRARLLEEREGATKGMALAARQAELAVAQQSEAAEREDFELADKLAGMIDKHAADEKEHERILHNINLAVKELDTQREDVMKGLTQCFIDVQMNLRQFKNEREELEKNNGKKVRSYATIICVYNCMCAFIDVCILCPIAFSSIMYNASPHSVPHSRSLHHLGQRQVPDDIQASFCRGGKTCYGSEAS